MKTITAKDLKQRLEQKSCILIDVREDFEHQSEAIEEACLIPLAELCCARLPKWDNAFVLHCRFGVRSGQGVDKLLKENPNLEIYALEGGIEAWKGEGYPTHKVSCQNLFVEQQAQIAAGSLVLIGLGLGAFVNSYLYLISAFVGVELIFRGISGFCWMSRLLAIMPSNKTKS